MSHPERLPNGIGEVAEHPKHHADNHNQRCLRGPIPLRWLQKAAQLPGKALALGIALWHLSGLKKKRTVSLSEKVSGRWGISRKARYRALKALEDTGLILVKRRPGARLRATLLDAPVEDDTNSEAQDLPDAASLAESTDTEEAPKRRGRPRKYVIVDDASVDLALNT